MKVEFQWETCYKGYKWSLNEIHVYSIHESWLEIRRGMLIDWVA